MTIDDIGRDQGRRVVLAAGQLIPPTLDAFRTTATRRRTRQRAAGLLAAICLIVAAAVGVATLTRRPPPAAPPGVVVHHVARPDLGFSLDIPQSWTDTAALYGTEFGFGSSLDAGRQRGFVNASILDASTLQEAADSWIGLIQEQLHGSIKRRAATTLDGRPAVQIDSTGINTRLGNPFSITETNVVFQNSAGAFVAVAVGGPSPLPNPALQKWIRSTIRIT
jgi:hypothetical protein